MEIVNIKLKSKNNPNIFLITTLNKDYEMHSDIIVKNNITVGEIDDKIFYNSLNESERVIGFNLATKYISSKLKTEQQIKDYLYKKEFHTNAINDIIIKLKEYKLLNDENYVKAYINSNKNFSKNKIKQKLYLAGAKQVAIENNVEKIDDLKSCIYHAEKFLKNKQVDNKTLEKLVRRLNGLGYNWDTIKSVLNKLKIDNENFD